MSEYVPTPDVFSRLNLFSVLDSLPDGVTLADAEGRIVFGNRAAEWILGVGAATGATPEAWGDHYGTFMPDGVTPFPPDEYPLLRAVRGEHPHEVEMVIRNARMPEGAVISVSGQPILDESGNLVGAAVVFRDITQLRSAQRGLEESRVQLERTQRVKDELAAFIVHDLKNPLSAILTTCELMVAGDLNTVGVGPDVHAIREAAGRMHRMVMDLLDTQLAEDGAIRLKRESIGIAQLLEDLRASLQPRFADRTGRLVIGDPGTHSVLGDRSLLFRVLANLVDNCLKYGPKDGTVWVEAAAAAGGATRLTVRDEGPGVRPELRDRIFDRYAQVEREEGTRSKDSRGLGLRFCKVVIDAHGGRIWVEDGRPRGARFCIELPTA